MTAREDFRSAVREAERSGCLFTEGQFRAVFRAGDASVTAALLALAAELEAAGAATGEGTFRPAASAYSHAAQMARERASASRSATNPMQSVSGDAGTGSVDLGDADDCMEAGP